METFPFSAGYEEAIARGDAKGLKNSQICATENTVHQVIYNLASTGNWWRQTMEYLSRMVLYSDEYSYGFPTFQWQRTVG